MSECKSPENFGTTGRSRYEGMKIYIRENDEETGAREKRGQAGARLD